MPPRQSSNKQRAPRNRTLTLSVAESRRYGKNLLTLSGRTAIRDVKNRTIHQDTFEAMGLLPKRSVDLLILDPPYNLRKSFNGRGFQKRSIAAYAEWFDSWFCRVVELLKPTASVYICADWNTSTAVHLVASRYLNVRNRITWEREKGRGALSNWKNGSEDIWFCTAGKDFHFDVDAVKLRRRVLAPYTEGGQPKDWEKTGSGRFRLTHPSNIWSDITVPFWSMPENTDHPTQKPEKLIAKLILASSRPGDLVLDPFLGSGTTSVVAKKLGRDYLGIEIDRHYACLAEKRLALAEENRAIQGYADGLFWERNSAPPQK